MGNGTSLSPLVRSLEVSSLVESLQGFSMRHSLFHLSTTLDWYIQFKKRVDPC